MSIATALMVPGRFCVGPTNLALDYPHGGVDLGELRDCEVRVNVRAKITTAEEWGGTVTEAWYMGEAMALAMVLREVNTTAIAAVFPQTSAGASGGRIIGGTVSGTTGRTRPKYPLLFSPKAVDVHPLVLVYAATALPDASAKLALAMNTELGIASVWYATPGANGKPYRIGIREDLIAAGAL